MAQSLTQYVIEREYKCTPKTLFAAFTDPAQLVRWVWGNESDAHAAEVDLTVNGTFNIVTDIGSEGGSPIKAGMRGVYLVIEPNVKLIHTLHWDAPVGYNQGEERPLDEIIVLDFAATDDGCLLRYRHMGIPDDGKSADEHERGVRITLDVLAKLVEN